MNAQWGADLHRRVEDEGLVFLSDSAYTELGHPSWYASTFHAPWYVFEHWAQFFAIRAYIPTASLGLQDQVLLQRTDNRPSPIAARPPRSRPDPALPTDGAFEVVVRAGLDRIGRGSAHYGRLGARLRAATLRLMRPYTVHQATVTIELAKAIDTLAASSELHDRRLGVLEQRSE